MVPMRLSSIFKSRWMALIWAAGIIWAAYDFAGDGQQGQNGNAAATDASVDANKIAQALGN